MNRDQFIQQARSLDWLSSLTENESVVLERFARLRLDTFDFLISAGDEFAWLSIDPAVLDRKGRFELSPSLRARWESWKFEYDELRARNPRLELWHLMEKISESHNASSWPVGYEWRISDWVDADDPTVPPPFDDRHGIVTSMFYQRIRAARRLCDGWFYWNDELKRVVFSAETEWQVVRAAQQAAAAEHRRRSEEADAKFGQWEIGLKQLVSVAREDAAYWNALKEWEVEQEARAPGNLQSPPSISGPVRIAVASQSESRALDKVPIDPIFEAIIKRHCCNDGDLDAVLVVGCLRSEVRRDLGLSGSFSW